MKANNQQRSSTTKAVAHETGRMYCLTHQGMALTTDMRKVRTKRGGYLWRCAKCLELQRETQRKRGRFDQLGA